MQEKEVISKEQKLILKNRKELSVDGVENVESFSDKEIILISNLGKIQIKGENLSITVLNVENGIFSLVGNVNSIVYSKKNSESMIKKILR